MFAEKIRQVSAGNLWVKNCMEAIFHPLSRVPPSGFIAWGSTWAKPALTHHGNGYAALPIGARIRIF